MIGYLGSIKSVGETVSRAARLVYRIIFYTPRGGEEERRRSWEIEERERHRQNIELWKRHNKIMEDGRDALNERD